MFKVYRSTFCLVQWHWSIPVTSWRHPRNSQNLYEICIPFQEFQFSEILEYCIKIWQYDWQQLRGHLFLVSSFVVITRKHSRFQVKMMKKRLTGTMPPCLVLLGGESGNNDTNQSVQIIPFVQIIIQYPRYLCSKNVGTLLFKETL